MRRRVILEPEQRAQAPDVVVHALDGTDKHLVMMLSDEGPVVRVPAARSMMPRKRARVPLGREVPARALREVIYRTRHQLASYASVLVREIDGFRQVIGVPEMRHHRLEMFVISISVSRPPFPIQSYGRRAPGAECAMLLRGRSDHLHLKIVRGPEPINGISDPKDVSTAPIITAKMVLCEFVQRRVLGMF